MILGELGGVIRGGGKDTIGGKAELSTLTHLE